MDLYSSDIILSGETSFGSRELALGEHTLMLEIVGANPSAVPAYLFGLDYLKLVAMDPAAAASLQKHNDATGAPGNCQAANPNDALPDDEALQACLDAGGTVALAPGNPGYLLAKGVTMSVPGTVLTSISAPAKARIEAAPDLIAPLMLDAPGVDGITVEHIVFDGNKAARSAYHKLKNIGFQCQDASKAEARLC